MTRFASDVRLGIRALWKSRGFTAAVVLTLALGMTLCTAVMTVANAYLLNDLPYPAADRLFWIRYGEPGEEVPQRMEALDWTAVSDVIEHPVSWDLDMFYLLGGEHAESVPGAWVTPGFMQALGIRPALGRGFDPDAFVAGGANAALISHRLWTTRFGGDPSIVGRTFTAYVSDRPDEAERFTVIGVLPHRFWHLNAFTDILTPLRAPSYPYMARLRPGVTPEAAAARIGAFVASGAASVPAGWRPRIVSAHGAYVQTVQPVLRTLAVAAALVLLVACGNVAGLLLVRATRRQKEVAVRMALGANRWRIARMLLAEAVTLAAAATALALMVTRLTLTAVVPAIQQQLGRSAPGGERAFALDSQVVAFAGLTGLLVALMCALVPLSAAGAGRLRDGLAGGGRTATEGGGTHRARAVLIAAEVALSLALLAGSTLMLRSVKAMLDTDLGVTLDRVLNASVTLRQNRYPDPASRTALFDRLAVRLSAAPGVESVSFTTGWPLQQPHPQPVRAAGDEASEGVRSAVQAVSGSYFDTVGMRILDGATFTRADGIGAEGVAIVSESFARRLWPGTSAVGQRLIVEAPDRRDERRIVGIAADVRQGPADTDPLDVYVPIAQSATRSAFVLVRTAGVPAAWLPGIRSAVRGVDPELAVDRARPMQAALDEVTSRPRFLAWLLAAFAIAASLQALVGVYGVIAYAVGHREREIAVRIAVGADPARITRLFVRQGAAVLGAGLAVGLLGALAGGRFLRSQLFAVRPDDPIALTIAVIGFSAAGLAAIWWPSRRAARSDPALALRAE